MYDLENVPMKILTWGNGFSLKSIYKRDKFVDSLFIW